MYGHVGLERAQQQRLVGCRTILQTHSGTGAHARENSTDERRELVHRNASAHNWDAKKGDGDGGETDVGTASGVSTMVTLGTAGGGSDGMYWCSSSDLQR